MSDGEYLGCLVAIKRLRVNEGSSDRIYKVPSINLARSHCLAFTQRLCQEIIKWKHLSHPNILPLLGVSASIDPYCFRIVTEWMPNGSITRYTNSNPEANRLRLVNILAVSSPLLSYSSRTFSSPRSCLLWPISTASRSFMGISKGYAWHPLHIFPSLTSGAGKYPC